MLDSHRFKLAPEGRFKEGIRSSFADYEVAVARFYLRMNLPTCGSNFKHVPFLTVMLNVDDRHIGDACIGEKLVDLFKHLRPTIRVEAFNNADLNVDYDKSAISFIV